MIFTAYHSPEKLKYALFRNSPNRNKWGKGKNISYKKEFFPNSMEK